MVAVIKHYTMKGLQPNFVVKEVVAGGPEPQ